MNTDTDSIQAIPNDARMWAMACHLMALTGLLGNGIGFLLGPLVMWLIKREDHPFINAQGKEAINFQITMLLAMLVCVPLIFVVIGLLLLPILAIVNVVFTIIAGVKAANGEPYRYPISLRLIK